jgi:hypothetical protein
VATRFEALAITISEVIAAVRRSMAVTEQYLSRDSDTAFSA